MSRAILDWAYPLIYAYGKLQLAGREKEAKAFKSARMTEFEEGTLSDPMDQVHLNTFPVDVTRKDLKTVRMQLSGVADSSESVRASRKSVSCSATADRSVGTAATSERIVWLETPKACRATLQAIIQVQVAAIVSLRRSLRPA